APPLHPRAARLDPPPGPGEGRAPVPRAGLGGGQHPVVAGMRLRAPVPQRGRPLHPSDAAAGAGPPRRARWRGPPAALLQPDRSGPMTQPVTGREGSTETAVRDEDVLL